MSSKQAESTASTRNDREAWERAEVERSAVEARDAEAAGIDRNEVARYVNPSKATPYSLEYAFALLGDLRGKRVLDFGCGSGANSVVLRAKGADVVALDISPHLLAVTEKRLLAHGYTTGTDFLLASGHQMPIPDASLDVVFGAAILHHLDLAEASSEVRRVLKPGGNAIFIEPVRDPRLYRTFRRLMPNRDEDISPFEYPLNAQQLQDFSCGFSTTARRRFILPGTTVMQKLNVAEPVIRWARKFDAGLMRLIPQIGYWATIEVFQITKLA
jgi:SAM-dependent methyltransferase